jgi:hypothetical protein
VAHAANDALDDLLDCFTEDELDEIHGAVVSVRAKSDCGR